ncbi:uncharacterized protein LOC142784399 [Rhipicephalus microplus]|uniref:uncharacterized protein LOC142784399 n=1 Tax=Rhipicephalus microplus TaxID=6941 RepID=UPI003F6C8207
MYDPLWFLSSFTVRAKIFLQDLWKENLGWDDTMPMKLSAVGKKLSKEVAMLHEISIPRFIEAGSEGAYQEAELHIISDASGSAYGAVAYLRTVDSSGTVHTILLMAKTRVAPLKTITLARLELFSALLAAHLYAYIIKNCNLGIGEVTFW